MAMQRIPFDTASVEQAQPWLQHHIIAWSSYAFALARQAGLGPEEAARFFMQPILDEGQATFQADAERLEQQARQNALIMAAFHGANNVQLERDGETWLLKIATTEVRAELEPRNIPLEFFARWLGEQSRLIGEPKGIAYITWLEGDSLCMQLTLAAKS